MSQFGGKVTPSDIEKYSKSKQWDGKKFLNLEETAMDIGITKIPGILYKQIFQKKDRAPEQPLPIIPFDKEVFLAPSDKAKFIWYGHSVVLLRMNGKTILIDPMLGPDAAPIAPFKSKRFSDNTLNLIDDFPEIDLLIMTHDHYDHLDLASMKKLIPKVKKYFVGLGVARHLAKWGVSSDVITEFDWWDHQIFEGIEITYTPTRHFSGRGLTDRAKSLWGGWVFNNSKENIWFSGDGGYGAHFKEIGARLGPFDFGFMECGQYNENWHLIHMYPEESVQAAMDAGAKKIMPVHWAGFTLSLHSWTDPVERFAAAAEKEKQSFFIPQLGQILSVDSSDVKSDWFKEK